ncbi:extracellular solute-binding protein [Acutalibacter caecimuris]|uniref:extracellular solute-binding protein n=1 Tax=Acutalibacter caecimuris TaxID=3093657 RepID=UPI002AC9A23A|nr:extracellular solute-binding protein [Acutalibacter sp. M00118]
MKKFKRLMALVMALALALSVAACGNDGSSSGQTSSAGSSEASGESSSAEGGESSGEAAQAGTVQLPLTTEPVTLTYWVYADENCAIMKEDYNDNEFYQEMEKRTGVHLEFELVAAADRQTNFNLMIASNQLTDLIYAGASYYAQGLDAAIDDGYFLDLTDKVDEYMPNYQAIRKSDPNYERPTITDSGRIGTVYELRQSKQGPWLGMWMRKDWLDKLEMDVPETFDQWHDVLTAFKDKQGATAALMLNWSGSDGEIGQMSAGYGVLNNWQLDESGNVNYGPYMEGWKKYVTTMHQWYTEGLIDPDFMATDERAADMTTVVTGKSGAFPALYTLPSLYEASSEDPDMYLIPVRPPVENAGDELHLRLRDSYVSGNTAISAQCEHPDIAMRWLDYLFTEEGALLANYGVEGDTFEYDADGKIAYTDKMLNNENGWTAAQTMASYLCPSSGIANWSDWTRELINVPEKDQDCYEVWGAAGEDYRLPALSLTPDESVERAALYADISTLVKENTAKFISGAMDIESSWDKYISDLESMGVKRAIEITQGAYDRYKAR